MASFTTDKQLESLLRGELAAGQAYHRAIERLDDAGLEDGLGVALRTLQAEHGRAAAFFTDELKAREIDPPAQSGFQSRFAPLPEAADDRSLLQHLREGEKRILEDYRSARVTGKLDGHCGRHVDDERIPAQQRHLKMLDALIRQQSGRTAPDAIDTPRSAEDVG